MYFLENIPRAGINICLKDNEKKYIIGHMRWTDGLNKITEENVARDARRIVASLNFCEKFSLEDLESLVKEQE